LWAVEDLLDVREDEDGEREFLVKWAGEKRKGVPWADSWEPEHFCNETAVRDFDFKVGVLDGLQLSGLDVTPLAELTRKKVADALKACKGREIACMHDLALDFLAHESLFRAFVLLASRPRALPSVGARKSKFDRASAAVLEVEETKHYIQLCLTDLKDIANFCSLEKFLGRDNAVGLLRHDMGRDFNKDLQAVAFPLVLTAKRTDIAGIFSVSLKFPSVHFLGKFGTPEAPQMEKGMLKLEENKQRFVAFVRKALPASHELAQLGWTRLPRGVYSLAKEVAMPDE